MKVGGGGWLKLCLYRVQAVLSRVSSVYHVGETATEALWEELEV